MGLVPWPRWHGRRWLPPSPLSQQWKTAQLWSFPTLRLDPIGSGSKNSQAPLSPRVTEKRRLRWGPRGPGGPALKQLSPSLPRCQGKGRLISLPSEEHQPKSQRGRGLGCRSKVSWSQLKLTPTQWVTGRIRDFTHEGDAFNIIGSNLLISFPQGANREGQVLPKVAERLDARARAIQVS